VTDAQVLKPISPRRPLSVNATTCGADVSPQYELTRERQRTLDGRWEPPRYRQRPEPVERVADEATAELFDEGRRQPTLPPTRPKGGLDRQGDKVAAFPLGDPSALPKSSSFTDQFQLIIRLMGYVDSLPLGRERGRVLELLARLEGCGARAIPGLGFIDFHAGTSGSAYVAGVMWCGRWLCPACGSFAQRRRREALVERAPVVAAAGRTFLFTPTLRHRMGVRYSDLRHALAAVTKAMKHHRQWRKVIADVRADEVTWGRHGFHLHKHILLTLAADADVDAFRDWLETFWSEQARKQGRTCEWPKGGDWWTEVAPERVAGAAAYLQKVGEEDEATGAGLLSVAAGEVLGASAKRGSRPWDLPAHAYVEAWFGSLRQRTFAISGLWRTKATVAVEAEEDAADQRTQTKPKFARVPRPVWRELDMETRRWVRGSLTNAALRPDWIVRLESVFGADLEVLCQPGETPSPPPPQTPPDAPEDDEPVSDPTGDPQRVLALPPPAVSLARGCGGDAPTEAQGAAADGTEADVAPQPADVETASAAPESVLSEEGRSVARSDGLALLNKVFRKHPDSSARRVHDDMGPVSVPSHFQNCCPS
jgi:hypothetical protein